MFSFSIAVDSPEKAMWLGKHIDIIRKQQLNLDTSSIKGKTVSQFIWDDTHLVLEFSNDLFLIIEILASPKHNQFLSISIATTHKINTSHNIIYHEVYPRGTVYDWNPDEVACKYSGKIFRGIYIGDESAYLYFYEADMLIRCGIQVLDDDKKVLSWAEDH